MDIDLMIESLPKLLKGTLLSLELVTLALVLGMVVAIPLALFRISRVPWLRTPAYCYIYFFRATPLLVQIFLIYYGFSQFAAVRDSFLWPVLRESYWCAIIAFTLNTSAYTGEILRGAMESVPWGQIEAGRAMGMSRFLLFRRIIGPQAIVLGLPGYCNEIIMLLKGSSLASTITMMELTGLTRNIIAITYKPIELFLLAGVIYMSLTFIITRLFNLVEYRITTHRRPVEEPEYSAG
jgi:putative lysine/arginine/ornithine/histidine/octopine transport system permease protein